MIAIEVSAVSKILVGLSSPKLEDVESMVEPQLDHKEPLFSLSYRPGFIRLADFIDII